MKVLDHLLFLVGFVRMGALFAMALSSLWLMRRLGRDRERRHVNPAVWSGLFSLASSGAGMGMLMFRQLLLLLALPDPGAQWWWLFYSGDPDSVHAIGYGLCSALAGIGVIQIVLGIYALVYRDASCELKERLPRWLRVLLDHWPRWPGAAAFRSRG